MKILYHHRVGSKDGQYVHIEELVRALERRGHEVILVGPAATGAVDFGGEASLVASLKRHLPRAIYELLELAHGIVAQQRLVRAYRAHKPDALYERYSLHLPAGALLKRRFDLPFLLEVNAPLAEERERYGGLGLPRLARASERWTWRSADRVFAVTRVLAGHVERAGVPAERIAITPNGIDLEHFRAAPGRVEAKRRLGLEGKTVVGFTGFVREWHRLDRVLGWLAASAPEHVHVLLIGDGPARADLERQAQALGVRERFHTAGIIAREDIPSFAAAFDVALQPAVVPYASPLKLFEYMALGLAIVAPDSPNIREILSDGEDALLVPEAELSAAVERLIADPELAQRLGRAARATLERRDYTWDANAERVEAAIRMLRRDPLMNPPVPEPAAAPR
jgi:glycosyltransferase involved in cell wall biosynthesis